MTFFDLRVASMLLFRFTMKGFEPNRQERLMGWKMPSLSPQESRTDVDMSLLSCSSLKEKRRKDKMGRRGSSEEDECVLQCQVNC